MAYHPPKNIVDGVNCTMLVGKENFWINARDCEGGSEVIYRPMIGRSATKEESEEVKHRFWDKEDMVLENPKRIDDNYAKTWTHYCYLKNN